MTIVIFLDSCQCEPLRNPEFRVQYVELYVSLVLLHFARALKNFMV